MPANQITPAFGAQQWATAMNTGRLLEFLGVLLNLESAQKVQDALVATHQVLEQVAVNPQDVAQQSTAAARLTALKESLEFLHNEITPSQVKFLGELDADWAFSPELATQISDSMATNAMTPVVARDLVGHLVQKREKLLNDFRGTRKHMMALGITENQLAPGEAQLGFLVPRGLFENTLGGLAKELKEINRFVETVAEALGVEDHEVVLEELSTTDPLVIVDAAVPVVLAIGAAIEYFLARWKKVEEIRNLREQTRGLKMANDAAVKSFDEHLTAEINKALDARVDEILPQKKVGRDNELATSLRMGFEYLMSRIERGMQVEIRFLPPLSSAQAPEGEKPAADDGADSAGSQQFESLAKVQQSLSFGEITKSEPILKLAAPQNGEDTKARKKIAAKKKAKPAAE